jgi:hypothetical protein
MIDPILEETFPLSQATRRIASLRCRRNGKPIASSTLWRWHTKGLGGVRLEVVRLGGLTCTSEDAVTRFFSALSNHPHPTPMRKPSLAARIEKAERACVALGI